MSGRDRSDRLRSADDPNRTSTEWNVASTPVDVPQGRRGNDRHSDEYCRAALEVTHAMRAQVRSAVLEGLDCDSERIDERLILRLTYIKVKIARPYTMRLRAASAEATRRRILDAVVALLRSRFRSEIRLEDVAADAEVTVQTIINVFGGRSVLLDEGLSEMLRELRAQRLRPHPGDVGAAVAALVEHYEQFGDLVIRNLAENADRELIETGRAGHRQWVQRQFGPNLAALDGKERRKRTDQLVCACDVYTWKLLRKDMGRSRIETESTILATVTAIVRAA
jgi:AcrR family transcriptional regulator